MYRGYFCLPSLVLSPLQDVFVTNRQKGRKNRAKICRAVELRKYSYTDGCPGCDAAAKGARAVGHSDDCRRRMEAKMATDDIAAARVLRSKKRRGQYHGPVLTAKQALSAAAAKKELELLAHAAASFVNDEPASVCRRRRRQKGA